MSTRTYIVVGIVLLTILTALTIEVNLPEQRREGIAAAEVSSAVDGFAADRQLLQRGIEAEIKALAVAVPSPPVVPPPDILVEPESQPEPGFQLCLIDAKSCMALDSRPFVLCPASGDASCDRTREVVLLRAARAANRVPVPVPVPPAR